MNIFRVKDYQALSKKAAEILLEEVKKNENAFLGLATGSTPEGTYQEMVQAYKDGKVSFASVKTVNLDEYEGLEGTHEQSYRYFMNKHLFSHVDINPEQTFVPSGVAQDIQKELEQYEQRIRSAGGVDIQLLGLGHNGHIGFNEPDKVFSTVTHRVELNQRTLEANQRFFASYDEVPKFAYTQGIGTIMTAKKILLIVSGKDKREILHKALFGEVTPEVPASILQFHPNVVVVADEQALPEIPSRV